MYETKMNRDKFGGGGRSLSGRYLVRGLVQGVQRVLVQRGFVNISRTQVHIAYQSPQVME